MKINKVLIANRGEIALRIIRSLKKLGITSVALYTHEEEQDEHVKQADEAWSLGEGSLDQTWLNIPLIIDIAARNQAGAVHPGYGFLSENAAFAHACHEAGLIFIGPESQVIEKMGSKIIASQYAQKAGISHLPRLEGSVEELTANAPALGFPLLVKASAGGGGKGMIKVSHAHELQHAVLTASQQAQRYFADATVYVEKYVENPRHIEVQVLADHHGNVIHLGERECTLQRNHQKVVEEAPAAGLPQDVREAIHESAVRLASEVGYTNAGTVEFILDENNQFYFLEMNTRIQVEHPVTELITGLDLVELQLKIAEGAQLGIEQDQVKQQGHAIEMRLYAEDPANSFRPSAGWMNRLLFPAMPGLRVDAAIRESGRVHASFDAMVAKIITHGKSRSEAIEIMQKTLGQTLVHGVKTNLTLLKNIAADQLFHENRISTHSIAENLIRWSTPRAQQSHMPAPIIAAALFIWLERYRTSDNSTAWRMLGKNSLLINGYEKNTFYHPVGNNGIWMEVADEAVKVEAIRPLGQFLHFRWNNHDYSVVYSYSQRDAMFVIEGQDVGVKLPDIMPAPREHINGTIPKSLKLKASLYGKVLRVNVAEKQKVKIGEPLLVLESMKMENTILAPDDNIISRVNVKPGDQVIDGQILLLFESIA